MRFIRVLLILTPLAALVACGAPDKYSKVPDPSGPWRPANADPSSRDNNIVPLGAQADLR